MPRQFNEIVFDGPVQGGTAFYTLDSLSERLGQADVLVVHVVAAQATGTTPVATVQVEHSGDARTWVNKGASPEINTTLSTTAVTSVVGADISGKPSLGFVRLRIQIAGTNAGASLRIYACGRPVQPF